MSNELPLSELAKIPFETPEAMMAAIRDPRYSSPHGDGAYRRMVEARIGISTGIGTDQAVSLGVEQSIGIGTDGLAEDQKTLEQAYRESLPDAPLAVNPNRI